MLGVKIDHAAYVQENLEQQLRFLDNQLWDLEQVMQRLNSLSSMDGVLERLRKQRTQLEEARRTLDRMAQCLNKAILYYNSCENRIGDYAQQEAVAYKRHIIGTSSLQNISDLLHFVV